MKLWLISQDENRDYDTYDSAVVAAETEEDARATHPGGYLSEGGWPEVWVEDLSLVQVRHIGEAAPGIERGVICASFNAG